MGYMVIAAFGAMLVLAVAYCVVLALRRERCGQVDLGDMLSVYSDDLGEGDRYEVTPGLECCPFCGSGATVLKLDYGDGCVWGVFCVSDLNAKHSHGHYVDNYPTMDAAMASWNGGIVDQPR